MPKKAPLDLSGDLPPVDAPISGRTHSDEPLTDLPVDEPREEMGNYPTGEQLQKRIDTDISVLLQRFEDIMALAAGQNDSHADTAVNAFQLDVDVTALIRAAEDLLGVTRIMKEMWAFGNLNTVGEDEQEVARREKMEADVLAIWKAIEEKNLLKLGLKSSEEPSEKPALEPSIEE